MNLAHLRELLDDNEHIQVKRETLRSWAHEIHHVKRAKRRRTQARKRRERMVSPGLLLQMDGSPHHWFGDKKSCLIAIIDDATISTILEETGDFRMAQALAGHSDPKTTANYDRHEIKEMRKAAGSLHFPLASNDK